MSDIKNCLIKISIFMKKLLIIGFLTIGTMSFASSGKVVESLKIKPINKVLTYRCQVGDVIVDSFDCACNACAAARTKYCSGLPAGTAGCN